MHLSLRLMMSQTVKAFDYLVIGGGSGGLGSARRASLLGAKAAIIEQGRLGGTCVSIRATGANAPRLKAFEATRFPVMILA